MADTTQRQTIYNHWFRLLIGDNISIEPISNITMKYARAGDRFSYSKITHCKIKYENKGCTVAKIKKNQAVCPVFGYHITKSGYLYNWKIKIIKHSDNNNNNNTDHDSGIDVNIGIIQSKMRFKCMIHEIKWYFRPYGYSYWSKDGLFYTKRTGIFGQVYGDKYGVNDIINVRLDLRDGKDELSFSKNDEPYGEKINVNTYYSYGFSLALTMCGAKKKVELISLNIS